MTTKEEALNQFSKMFNEKFELVVHEYEKPYGWPEMDTLRYEICGCISFGFNQAAITLTNHMLESLLKYALSYHYAINNEKPLADEYELLETMMKYTEDGFKKYGKTTLDKNIKEAKTIGLINEDEYNKLQMFRVKFRNSFGHSDKEKTFGDMSLPVSGAKLKGATITPGNSVNIPIAKMPILQGLAQAELSENQAPVYFLEMDKIVRSIKDRVFPQSKDA